jgi:hypothetical protein
MMMVVLRRVVVLLLLLGICAQGQSIRVDITPGHVRNKFIPNQTLGAGIDRISKQTIDTMFVPAVVQRVLQAGWGPVTYRQNTELYT